MGSAVEITRLDLTAGDLRCRAQRSGSIEAARRMLALALILEGRPRAEAARTCGMDRQTLRDWFCNSARYRTPDRHPRQTLVRQVNHQDL